MLIHNMLSCINLIVNITSTSTIISALSGLVHAVAVYRVFIHTFMYTLQMYMF